MCRICGIRQVYNNPIMKLYTKDKSLILHSEAFGTYGYSFEDEEYLNDWDIVMINRDIYHIRYFLL